MALHDGFLALGEAGGGVVGMWWAARAALQGDLAKRTSSNRVKKARDDILLLCSNHDSSFQLLEFPSPVVSTVGSDYQEKLV